MRPIALVSESLPCRCRGVAAAMVMRRDANLATTMDVLMEKPEV